ALEEILCELEGAEALVMDLRFNGGGRDGHSLAILSRLVAERTLAWTKEARSGPGWTPQASRYVEPSQGRRWTKPIYVLTSGLTASAAETFALGLSARPGVVFVGEPSAGIFSDMLPRRLPNGWIATLSNERYRGPDGSRPEGLGIRPGVEAPMDPALAAAGRDPALDAVMRLEAERRRGGRP
ncbi:MAG: S41 family peptidase, partial [Spirochaetaceae bacterium]|nr:S41 family peptidase [Spirochaetaceae bacterium]